jgi:hypothetical protein
LEHTREALRKRLNIAVEALGKILAGEISTRKELRDFLRQSYIEAGIEPLLGTMAPKRMLFDEVMVYAVAVHGLGLQEEVGAMGDLFQRERVFEERVEQAVRVGDLKQLAEFASSLSEDEYGLLLKYLFALWLLGRLSEESLVAVLNELALNAKLSRHARIYRAIVVAFKLAELVSSGHVKTRAEKEALKRRIAAALGDERSLPKDELVWSIAVNTLCASEQAANRALRLSLEELERVAEDSPSWWYGFVMSRQEVDLKLSSLPPEWLKAYLLLEKRLRKHLPNLSRLIALVLVEQFMHTGKEPGYVRGYAMRISPIDPLKSLLDPAISRWKVAHMHLKPKPEFEVRVESTHEIVVVDRIPASQALSLGVSGLRQRIYAQLRENREVKLRTGDAFTDNWLKLASTIAAVKIVGEAFSTGLPKPPTRILLQTALDDWQIELRAKKRRIEIYVNKALIGTAKIHQDIGKTIQTIENILRNNTPKEIKEKYLQTLTQEVRNTLQKQAFAHIS